MNRKNIVCIDYNNFYKNEFKLDKVIINNKSFKIINVNSIDNLKRQQGFLLILNILDLDKYNIEYIEREDFTYYPNVYELDRIFRKKFSNFDFVIIINPEEYEYGLIPFSNINLIYANNYYNEYGLIPLIEKLYYSNLNKKEIKFTKKRLNNINKLKKCIKSLRKDYFTTDEILKKLNVNRKWLQRYIKDMNYLYNNIGYNKIKRVWYCTKNNQYLVKNHR